MLKIKWYHHLIPILICSVALNIYHQLQLNQAIEQNKKYQDSIEGLQNNLQNIQQIQPFDLNDALLSIDKRFQIFQEQYPDSVKDGYFPIQEVQIDHSNFSANQFFQDFVNFNMPIVIRNITTKWKAFKLFRNETFMRNSIGNKTITVEKKPQHNKEFAYFKKDFVRQKMKYNQFYDLFLKYETEPHIYYWAEKTVPKKLQKFLKEPNFAKFMALEDINIWQGAAGTISLPHTDDRDNLLCQIVGQKEIILIPPTQRKYLYIDDEVNEQDEKLIKNYSPVNFFQPEYEKYPLFENIVGKMKVVLNEGDILFIPFLWWHHVKSSKGNNIAINYWYKPNFMHKELYQFLEYQYG